MKKKFSLIAVLIVLGISSTLVLGKDLYTTTELYQPATSSAEVQNEHSYMEMKDKYGSKVTVFIPMSYKETTTNKWVVFAHGSNGSHSDMLKLPGENSILKPLLDEGYVVIAPNYRDIVNWGNQQGVEDLVAAFELGEKQLNLEDNPYLIVQSMGGLIGLTAIAQEKITPKAMIGIYPVTNLQFEYQMEHDSIPGYISEAYDISSEDEFKDKTESYDPVNDYIGNDFSEIPMMLIASYEDEIVPREQNTDIFAGMVNDSGGSASVIDHQGNHGDISAFNQVEIIGFLNSH